MTENETTASYMPPNVSCWVPPDEEAAEFYNLRVVTYAYILPFICIVGIIGNLLNLLVLNSPTSQLMSTASAAATRPSLHASHQYKPPMLRYLTWMAFDDFMALAVTLMFFVTDFGWSVSPRESHYFLSVIYAHIITPLQNTFLIASALLVVAVTVERFLTITFPLQARGWMKERCVNTILIVAHVLPPLFYMPQAFEYCVSPIAPPPTMSPVATLAALHGVTSNSVTPTSPGTTEIMSSASAQSVHAIATSSLYKVGYYLPVQSANWFHYYKIVRVIIFKVSCTVLVSFLNVWSIGAYIRMIRTRRALTQLEYTRSQAERYLMVLLVCAAATYVICVTPMALSVTLLSLETINSYEFSVFASVANILEVCNSSLNFYIYCMWSENFRKQLK